MWRQTEGVAIVVVGLLGACNGKDATVPAAPVAVPKVPPTCLPPGDELEPSHVALTGDQFSFCFNARYGDQRSSCFTANLGTRTIVPASPPGGASLDSRTPNHRLYGREPQPTIEPSASGKGVTVCTGDRTSCHDLPIDPTIIGSKPTAVSDDATLVAVDTRSYLPTDNAKTPGKLETWDAVTGKKLASFPITYGPSPGEYPGLVGGDLAFFDHTVIAFTMPCALPCSTATMYSVRGTYLGFLAAEASSTTAVPFHDNLYVLHAVNGPLVVQDSATGKSVSPDIDTSWDAVVTPSRIVRIVGPALRRPRVDVWGPDLKLVTEIAVPMCPARAEIRAQR
ncbi:hypothetical protein BH11MYX3_BH11MYX3_16570 [soil metagenome]